MESSGGQTRTPSQTAVHAVFPQEHLDWGIDPLRGDHLLHFLRHEGMASHCRSELGWYLLGGRVLGSLRHYHGSESFVAFSAIVGAHQVSQFLKERERELEVDAEQVAREFNRRPSHSRTQSTPAVRPLPGEREPLLRRRRSFDEHNADLTPEADPVAGGTILGIHNLAIVFPQFIVSHRDITLRGLLLTPSYRLRLSQARSSVL